MGRLLRFIVVVGLLAGGVAWLAEHSGTARLEWLGWRIDTSVAFLVVVLALLVWLLHKALRLLAWILSVPEKFVAHRRQRRIKRGLSLASEAVSALIVEDPERARQSAVKVTRFLDETPLGPLLEARAATLDGHAEEARERASLFASETSTILAGLRFQFEDKIASGALEEATRIGTRILSLHPKAIWALRPQIAMLARRGEWEQAADVVAAGERCHVLSREEAARLSAVLFSGRADAALEAEKSDDALRWAKKAVAASPAFSPATLRLMRILQTQGYDAKAAAAAERAWSEAPHGDVADAYMALFAAEEPLKRVTRARQLASCNPNRLESRLLVAQEALEARLWGEARAQLLPLLETTPLDPRACLLMARIARSEQGDAAAAVWFEKALQSRDPRHWLCSACGNRSAAWTAFCPACGTFATTACSP